jgi:Na+/phosphate symporter
MLRSLMGMWKQDDLLQQAWRESYEMLAIDNEMFQAAVNMLRSGSGSDVAAEVHSKDLLVDAYEQDVRRKVLTHCTVHGTSDLPGSMTLVSIVTDIERIGDYVRHIVDLAANVPEQLHGAALEADLCRVEAAVRDCFGETRDCVQTCSEADAARVLEEYAWVKEVCYERIMDIVRGVHPELAAGQASALALYFRWLKRIGAHLLKITSSVISPFDRIGASGRAASQSIPAA